MDHEQEEADVEMSELPDRASSSSDEKDSSCSSKKVVNDGRFCGPKREDVHTRHPWLKEWAENGSRIEDLTKEQYPPGYDPKRNESEWTSF